MTSKVTAEELNTFFAEAFPDHDKSFEVTQVSDGEAFLRLNYSEKFLRPGNVISGPTQMALADSAAYVAIFTRLGITPFAVTTNLNINFLNACKAGDIIARAKLIKLGKRLAISEVDIREVNMSHPASLSIVTYALPA